MIVMDWLDLLEQRYKIINNLFFRDYESSLFFYIIGNFIIKINFFWVKFATKILKNKGFYGNGKKYHKIILKKVLTLVKNGGKLMPSSRDLTSELNKKTTWFFDVKFIWKINKKTFLKKF